MTRNLWMALTELALMISLRLLTLALMLLVAATSAPATTLMAPSAPPVTVMEPAAQAVRLPLARALRAPEGAALARAARSTL